MIIVTNTYVNEAQDAFVKNTNKKVIFKNSTPFTSYINNINNAQVDNAEDIDIVMPMYNLIEYITYISINHRTYIRMFMAIL